MTTIAELVDSAPDPTHGYVIANRPAVEGDWRFSVGLADPSAGADIVLHDVTGFYAGDHHERGAVIYGGRCQPATTAVTLCADDDSLAPWGQDTTDLFGVNIELDAGLIMRAAWARVVDGATVEWEPVWTGRVEKWGDNTAGLGTIRTHNIVVSDTIGDLVDVPLPEFVDTVPFDYRINDQILTFAADWPFGVDIYGDPDAVPDVPARAEQQSARAELAATVDPLGLVERTRRNGRLVVHPAPFDTLHGVVWPNPTTAAYPSGLVFSYNPDLTDIAYAVDDAKVPPFGIERDSIAVINNAVATMPSGAYPKDDPVSRGKYGWKGSAFTWIVDNPDAVDQLVAARAYATKQALPLTTRDDMPGFWPAMSLIDHLDPVTAVHANRPDGLVVTGTGTIRRIAEDREVLYEGSLGHVLQQTSVVLMDIVATAVSEPLLPVENLAMTSSASYGASFSWTNPVQPSVEPTDTQIRLEGYSMIWIDWPYPMTFWTSPLLHHDTNYQLDVRLVRKVNGIITHASAVRSVAFNTGPLVIPDLGPGDDPTETDVDIPVDPDCVTEWVIEEKDGDTVTTFMSGDQDDLVLGGDGLYHLPDPIDNAAFDDALLYRVGYREDCGDGFGPWIYGPWTDPPDSWTDPCTPPPALSEAPFSDDDLLVYVPMICVNDDPPPANSIEEAVSGIAGVWGSAFEGLQHPFGDPDRMSLKAKAQPAWGDFPAGVMAYGECPQIVGATGDKTMSVRCYIHEAEDVVLFECGGMRINCVAAVGGWRASVVVYKSGATFTLPTATLLDLDTEYTITATHELTTGDIILYVDWIEDNSVGGSDNAPTIGGVPKWRVGAPPESWITDCALWDGVLDLSVAVTINQGSGQADPASGSSVDFDVVFAESVTGFATGDVTLSGTAGATTATVAGSGTTYTVTVTGMTAGGTVIASIAAGVCVATSDGRPNAASTSTDNTVTWSAVPTANLWAHFDASNAGSITSSGGAVSQWDDLSGGGRHISQGTAGAKPSTGTRTINSLNVIDFDGGDFLARTAAIGFGTGNYTIIGFFGSDADSASFLRFLSFHNGSGNDYDSANALTVTQGDTGGYVQAFQGGGGAGTVGSGGGAGATPYRTWTVRKRTSGGGILEVTNATTPGAYVTGSASANGTANGGFLFGGGYEAGVAGTNKFNGAIGEILIYSTNLSDTDRDLAIAYLVAKWGA